MDIQPLSVIPRGQRRYRWSPIFGASLPLDATTLVDRCYALLSVAPHVIFCGTTAAELEQLPLPAWTLSSPRLLTVSVPKGRIAVERSEVRCRRMRLADDDVRRVRGLVLTTPERTFVDLAAEIAVPDLVAVGDHLLRNGLASRASLHEVVERLRGARGIRKARAAVDLLDARAESPQESRLRVLLLRGGLPRPQVNLEIFDDCGVFLARGDLVFETQRVVVEYDGEYHLTREQQRKDAERRLRLNLGGWLIVTLTAADLRHPEQAVAKVRAALAGR